MALNLSSPNIIARPPAEQALVAPVPPQDQTVANIGNAIVSFRDYLEKSRQEKVKALMDKQALEKAQNENEIAPFQRDKLKAEAAKLMQEVKDKKDQADALNQIIDDNTKRSEAISGAKPTSEPLPNQNAPVPSPSVQAPIQNAGPVSGVPKGIQDKAASSGYPVVTAGPSPVVPPPVSPVGISGTNITIPEVPINGSSGIDSAPVEDIPKSVVESRDYLDRLTAMAKAHKGSDFKAADLLKETKAIKDEMINDAIKTRWEDLSRVYAPKSYEEGKTLLYKLGGSALKTADQKEILDKLPTQMDLDKFKNEQNKTENANKENLVKNIKDFVPIIPAYNRVADDISKPEIQQKVGDALTYYKALTKSLNLPDAPGLLLNVVSALSQKSGLGTLRSSPDPRDQYSYKILSEMDLASIKKKIPPEAQKVFSNLSNLINQTIKKTAGSAVTANEFERVMGEYGLAMFSDPSSFFTAIKESGNRLNDELDMYKAGADDKALKRFTEYPTGEGKTKNLLEIRVPNDLSTTQTYDVPPFKGGSPKDVIPTYTPEEAKKLKPGVLFMTTDGKRRVSQ